MGNIYHKIESHTYTTNRREKNILISRNDFSFRRPRVKSCTSNLTRCASSHTSSCRYDYVELYDGADENAPLVGRYCGNKAPGTTFQSSGTDMFVLFRSDGSVTDTGFKAFYDFGVGKDVLWILRLD